MIQRCNDCPFDYPDKICDDLNCLIDIYKEQVEQLENQNKQLSDALISAKEDICRLCIVINPNHGTCKECDDMQYYIKLIESTT
jgi:hypothetical protein